MLFAAALSVGCAAVVSKKEKEEHAIPVTQSPAYVTELRAIDRVDDNIVWLPVLYGWIVDQDGNAARAVASVENHARSPGPYALSYPVYQICERVVQMAKTRDEAIYRGAGIRANLTGTCVPIVIDVEKPEKGRAA